MTQTDVHIHNCARCGKDAVDPELASEYAVSLIRQRDDLLAAAEAALARLEYDSGIGDVPPIPRSKLDAQLRQAVTQARGG